MSRKSLLGLIKVTNKLYGKTKGDEGYIASLKKDSDDDLEDKLVERLEFVIDTDPDALVSDDCPDSLAEFVVNHQLLGEGEEEEEEESEEVDDTDTPTDDTEDESEQDEEEEDEEEDSDEDEETEDESDSVDDEDKLEEIDDATSDGEEDVEIDLPLIASMIEAGFSKILEVIQSNGVVNKPRKKRGGPKGLSDEAQVEYEMRLDAAHDKALNRTKSLFQTNTTVEELQALAEKHKLTTTSSSIGGLKQAIRNGMTKRLQAKVTKEFEALTEA